MSGSWLNVAASISMPVESSRPVFGHLTITKMARSVTMGASRLKAFHKSFTRYRIGRNVTWELVVAFRPFNAIATTKSIAKAFAAITAKSTAEYRCSIGVPSDL